MTEGIDFAGMEPVGVAPPGPMALPPLDKRARRVLGVLIEKAFCTPDQYPLTPNALVAGCNQKSNRDPVTNFSTDQIDEALLELQRQSLVVRIQPASGRTDRWKHNIKEAWILDRPERAVVAELFLRGPQTEGELRGRASRMVEIPTLDELRTILDRLAARGFVVRLSPEGKSRGVGWTHKAFSPSEIESQRLSFEMAGGDGGDVDAAPHSTSSRTAFADAGFAERFEKLESELAAVRAELAELRSRIDGLP